MANPYIAIIRDGKSDFLVIQKFVSAIFTQHHFIELKEDNFFEFENPLNITNCLSTYLAKSHHDKHSLFGNAAKELRREISGILWIAVDNFAKNNDRPFCNKDVLVLNGDAEKILGQKQAYFADWAYSIYSVLWLAIEEFYDKMAENGYQHENLPLILPLILFPSSEILVAACMHDFQKENFRSFEAKPTLKQKVYETEHIPKALESGKLQEILDCFVVPESLSEIYKDIPETRKFMQILAFSPVQENKS